MLFGRKRLNRGSREQENNGADTRNYRSYPCNLWRPGRTALLPIQVQADLVGRHAHLVVSRALSACACSNSAFDTASFLV